MRADYKSARAGYIKTMSHDEAPREKEAEQGST